MITEMEWIDTFGDNLREIMQERGYTQVELADKTYLSQATISNYIHKKTVPTIKAVVNLSYALDCRVDDLVDFGDMIE